MKKSYILVIFVFLLSAKSSFAILVVENINKKLSGDTTVIDLSFGPLAAPLFTFNYFAIPGSISITGKITSEYNSSLLAEPIGGGNYTPTRLYNNADFSTMSNYARSPIFIHNNNLTFDNKLKGTGNNYLGARVIFPATKETIYLWILVNLNADGTELNIIKLGYEDEPGKFPLTGTEGQNNPSSSLLEQLKPQLNIYPQPATDRLFVQYPTKGGIELSVYNLSGELIYSEKDFGGELQVANWPAGIYFL
ncbi:MAG: T9SS type A sorting domain-containing protein, partial [Bacteroidia bacterium]|nr:T9SS type A sorting domain-containing protein [Bacteroidia bacterium]